MGRDDEQELIETMIDQDIWVDGCARFEIRGPIVRTVYYKWALVGGIWRKMMTDFAIVRPRDEFIFNGHMISGSWPVIEQHGESGVMRH